MIDTLKNITSNLDSIIISDSIKSIVPIQESDINTWIQNPNSIIAIVAILISLFTLTFSVLYNRKTIKITIKHNNLSVKPLLHFSLRIDSNEGLIKYELSNRGLGPAVFKYLVYKYEDDTFNNINDFFTALRDRMITSKQVKFNFNYKELTENTVISPNNQIQLFSIKVEPKNYTDSLGKLIDKINIKVFYRDMYDNEFTNA